MFSLYTVPDEDEDEDGNLISMPKSSVHRHHGNGRKKEAMRLPSVAKTSRFDHTTLCPTVQNVRL